MADIKGVRAIIEFALKKAGLIEAKSGIQDLINKGKLADSVFGNLGKKLAAVFAAAAVYSGLRQLTAFVVQSIQSFAGLERALGVVALQMKRLGIDADLAMPRVKQFLDAIERSGGATLEQSVPAFQQFLGMTKDVEAALYLLSLANEVAEAKNLDLADAASKVAAIYQGKAKQALQALGLEALDSAGKVRDNRDALLELEKMLAGIGTSLDDTANQLDIANAHWAEFGRLIGEIAAPAVKALNFSLISTLSLLESLNAFRKGEIALGDVLGVTEAGIKNRLLEQQQGPQTTSAGRNKALEGAGKSRIDKQVKDLEAAAKKALKAELDALEDYLDKYYEAQAAKEEAALAFEQRRAEAVAAANEAEREQIAQTEQVRQEIKEMTLAMLQEGTEQWLAESLAQEEERYKKEVQLAKDNLELIVELRRKHELKVAQIHRTATDTMSDSDERAAADKMANMQAIADASTAFLQAQFGQSKTAAIAQVAIDLALSIMRIWSKHGDNVYVAAALTALVSATAHAQIERIRKASFGGTGAVRSGGNATSGRGFDDPVNDRLVYEGSRRWARDQVRLMRMGFGDVWRDMAEGYGSTTNTTTHIDNQSHVNVHMHGRIIRAERDLRDLGRDLRRVERRDNQARQIR